LLARYLEPFEPRWDGGHLAWLWSRLKDQSLFFPWYQRDAAARLALDATPVETLARSARDWLRSGTRYRDGYAAAMRYDPRADLRAIRTPHHIFCLRDDPLSTHLQRLPELPDNFQVRSIPTAQQCTNHVLEQLADYSAGRGVRVAPAAVPTRPIAGRAWHDYVTAMGMQLRVLRAGHAPSGAAGQSTLLVQHGAQGSLRCCAEMVSAAAAARTAMAIELPGHGETDEPAAGSQPTFPELAQLLQSALEALGVRRYDLVGLGAGAAVMVELLHRAPERVHSLTLVAPLDMTGDCAAQAALLDSYRPWSSDSHGGFLLRAWHEARDHLLFFPWYERRRAFAAAEQPELAPAQIHACAVDVLLAGDCGAALRRAELRYPLRQRLGEARDRSSASLTAAVRIAATKSEPRFAHARQLAGSQQVFLELARDAAIAARQLVAANV
jgi:pimeloyl-ACP methyl ester carboxylesterase